jgi:fructokinase
LALRRQGYVSVPGFSVQVADTVGAGDAFTAGLLAALSEMDVTSRTGLEAMSEEVLTSTLSFGAAVAGITCTRVGADPPQRREVVRFLGEE